MDLKAIVLHSGRGIRYAILTPTQQDAASAAAARLLDKTATVQEYIATEKRVGVELMVKEYSTNLLPGKSAADPGFVWSKYETDGTATKYNEVFGAGGKDHAIIGKVYEQEHGISQNDLNDVLSRAIAVTS